MNGTQLKLRAEFSLGMDSGKGRSTRFVSCQLYDELTLSRCFFFVVGL